MKKFLSILLSLALVLSVCPTWALAAEGDEPAPQAEGTPTRTKSLDLSNMPTTDKTSTEGWSWDAENGTPTLTDCYIQSSTLAAGVPILKFPIGKKITIILNGDNVLETTSDYFAPMISRGNTTAGEYYIISLIPSFMAIRSH